MKKKILLIVIIVILIFLIIAGLNFNRIKKLINSDNKSGHSNFNILLITLDTTRADKIGYYGCLEASTPNIDSLASQGATFFNAYSPVPLTLPAHCSIFTGLYPNSHKVRNNGNYYLSDHITTLTEMLKNHNYATSAFVASFTVDSRFGLNQGFDHYNEDIVQNRRIKAYNSERRAESVYNSFKTWFEINYNKKFFSWVHFFDPHDPYDPPEPFKSKFKQDLYLGEIAYTDLYVGKIIDLLTRTKLLAKTLVIIAGDHGEAFGEHLEFGHQVFCYQENIKIPMIIYAKDLIKQGKNINDPVNLVDLMPTILDFLKLPVPKNIQGLSLMPLVFGNKIPDRDLYFESLYSQEALGCAPLRGIISENYKFIALPKAELYDLGKDPLEKTNLTSPKPLLIKKLKGKLLEFTRLDQQYNFSSARQVDTAEKKRLASLGYLSGSNKKNSRHSDQDPKDLIKGYNLFLQGIGFLGKKDLDNAEKYFNLALKAAPKFNSSYNELARIYLFKKKPKEAIEIFEKGIKNSPDDFDLKLDFASFLLGMKYLDRSLEILKALEKIDRKDKFSQVQLHMADIYFNKEDLSKAVTHYLKIIEVEPQNIVILKKLAFIFHNSGNFKQAMLLYLKIEGLAPQDQQLMHDMAVLYSQLKEYQKADMYYLKALKDPVTSSVYYNYALLLAGMNKYRDAENQMKKFIELYQRDDKKLDQAKKFLAAWQNK